MAAKTPSWSAMAPDYALHRKGYPEAFYEQLREWGAAVPGTRALDLGCGTGDVARGLARRGTLSFAADPCVDLMGEGRRLPGGSAVRWARARGEALPFPDSAFDTLSVASAFAWMDQDLSLREAHRVLKPSGRIVLAHFYWLAEKDSVGAVTQEALSRFSDWNQRARPEMLERWSAALENAGFETIESFDLRTNIPYKREGWRGRIRASVPVAGRMNPEETRLFDAEHARLLGTRYPEEEIQVAHRVFALHAINPA